MVIWFGFTGLKLTFSYGKLYANFGRFIFFREDGHEVSNLQISKILNTNTNQIFPIPFKVIHIYLWDIHSLKNNTAVSRSGYLYRLNQKFSLTNAFVFFKLKVRLWNIKKRNNPLLSKYTLEYLVFCLVFWVEARPVHTYMGVGVLLLHFQ